MTSRTVNQALRPTDTLDICPCDAAESRIEDGALVRVVSRSGEICLPARIDARLKRGELFATFHDPARWVNEVTSGVRDRKVSTPEYKVTAVRIEKV
jgi:formate dehydrogenase major subunit